MRGDRAVAALGGEDRTSFAVRDDSCGCRAGLDVGACGDGEGGGELGRLFEDGGVG